jgi:hypothetical protein
MEPARKFRIIVNSKECGTCSGATPSAVAKKVVKKLCGTSSKVVKFSLKECKRGCERECGPYQGRMEKLDKPCKRDGKMITHRVVCGKVRKMRGGRDLVDEDFNRPNTLDKFREENIDGKPHVFFGGKYNTPFKFVIFNNELVKLFGKKTIGISVLEEVHSNQNQKIEIRNLSGSRNKLNFRVKPIRDLENLSLELQYELSKLRELLKNEREYKTIREFLKKYDIVEFIKEQKFSNIPSEYTTYSNNYGIHYNPHTVLVEHKGNSILFFDFLKSEPILCLVFTENDFIVIYINQEDIISIEDLFKHYFKYRNIYLLENNEHVPYFIKEKLKQLISIEKEIRTIIKTDLKNSDLNNIHLKNSDVRNELKSHFGHIDEEVFDRLISQEIEFIRKQVDKSKNAHMKNNDNKSINNVYNKNSRNNIYNYQRFLNEGKRLAIIKKAEEAEERAQRNAEKAEERAQINAEKAKRNAEKAKRNAEKAKRTEREEEERAQKLKNNQEEQNFMDHLLRKSEKFNESKKTLKRNEIKISMVKDFIKILYKKDNEFISKCVKWYSEKVLQIYRDISDNLQNRLIKHNKIADDVKFNTQLEKRLTAEKLYESDSFPKNNSFNYTYEESQAFATFFIDTLNTHMRTDWNVYSDLIYEARYNGYSVLVNILFMELKQFMMNVLLNKLKIKLNNNNNGNNNNNNNGNNNNNNNGNNGNGNNGNGNNNNN